MDRHITRTALKAIALACLASGTTVHAETMKYNLSQFVEVDVNAGYQQRDIKKVVLRVDYPQDVELVGQAINYSLLRTGYGLQSIKNMDLKTLQLLSRPLPSVHREFTDVTLENLISTLAGPAFSVTYDEYLREVKISPLSASSSELIESE
ncbi:hypothetical protein L1D14_10395 [Vibrio tubiashii]|uniref:PFGI-1 class ICE element type IV pilus protein PilL2 n=1 Tax=Vibrio tubiashii TaxID=29498 RepID=UPI001EFC7642|nr:hypothetical protein [Vibrio tubiashii]MCG9576646.1 hypothetical protein [Vibrio tubiashii]